MDNDSKILTIVVSEIYKNTRLDKFISSHVADVSRTQLQKSIKASFVTLNGEVCTDCKRMVEENDEIRIDLSPVKKESHMQPFDFDLDIVFEDEHIALINKPPYISVHPGAGNLNCTIANALVAKYGDALSDVADSSRPGIVHRLDKDTSGLMIIAKTNAAHLILSSMLAEREIRRYYIALVYGAFSPFSGTITTFYGRSKRDPKKMCVKRYGKKTAITHYKALQTFNDETLSIVECKLETGRTHQIRVHMEYAKKPVVGDQTYGRSLNHNLSLLSDQAKLNIKTLKRQFLHAYKLEFTHPITDEELSFEIDVPQDLKAVIDTLELDKA
ncbi:MAG: RluA family pseudouridine synthase [Alphaproteobacteria bacterium]|jgi:23S rRNA pseudouridine1911/1915/1917 synthase|nr:RluA family pseudouridine synthase [Candidatus Jidaibacter sp.]